MSRRRLLVLTAAALVAAFTVVGGSFLCLGTQSSPGDVLETVSNRQFEAGQAIAIVATRPGDKATIPADQLADRLEAAGFRSNLLESPKLVRFKGGAVPGAVGSGGLMWALVLDQSPEAGGAIVHPLTPSPGATGTYFIVFLSADTGDYIMALGGEKFGR